MRRAAIAMGVALAAATLVSTSGADAAVANPPIVFSTNRDGNEEIYRVNPDGTGRTRLTRNADSETTPSVDRARTKIAYRRYGVQGGIWLMNYDGSDQHPVVWDDSQPRTGSVYQPSLSADGSKIVMEAEATGTHDDPVPRDIFEPIATVNADGTGFKTLSWQGRQPVWSPDGTKIAFSGRIKPGGGGCPMCPGSGIWIMNADGRTGLRQVAPSGKNPAWSPDGTKIAYYSFTGGKVFWTDATSYVPHQVSQPTDSDIMPSWSPDGTRIAYASTVENRYMLYTSSIYGTDRRRVSFGGSNTGNPSWGY